VDQCPACGADLEVDAATCPACGRSTHEATAEFPPVSGPLTGSTSKVAADLDGPVLVVRRGPEVGERFYLDRERLTIGRDPECAIFLNDITVSRDHAVLTKVGGVVSIQDDGSLNGVYVNGANVTQAVLGNGDQVQIGRFQMVFLSGGGE
jgi:pSer/pThr/pTyr-binding forkhead associated (FHA) protein